MTPSASKKSAGSSTRRLSRDLIVQAALDQIDRSGAHGLSMRSLGQDLGVEAMSLYRHVQGKEDLLEGVVALLMGDLTSRLDDELAEHWQGFLQTVAHEVRRIAIEHPKAFPLVATRHPAAPWLRPPLRSIEVVNTFLSALISHGFTDAQAVDAYRSFSSFLLGHLLLESATRGAETGPVEEPLDEGGATIPEGDGQVPLDTAPEVRRLRALLSKDRSDEEFEVSLEALLDRLEREISQ
ncbi:TetR/AcrR family transcriptional regulator C-terminal domain-containing protein [Microbacterium sp. zg.B48]|uniref:TetR/AcrR family transcriptional regulator C-terminal domain-containing protein n=1 Tax=unclassified Microbacterium TaxID=2609290 RepID=UPI00214B1216|nr:MULTISPECIES: TetR/AcrR family transcriptional regulator C-terminal domain-containing protein [unclassified Microbacterium]MCR2764126.1 TetR/AcrR family transcriptional regulator C-terminal domain-containing protein [Microbacterium sp. zg.B48]MCR2809007.1 TetR/AcrR family transcriptional regulator C-terminal domain-containing protein [Microbacterium sp. zg.B185]WIM18582.1 TetR/AcrR family transcriptional regulator C-terminal domain-containing protein [Microbacterium sp. zg-B185]